MQVKTFAKKWLPPAFLESLKPLHGRAIYFSGDYADWATASAHANGYDSALILERVRQAMFRVKSGEAVYERDSVVFDKVQHSFPVLAALLRAALENGNRLTVLDFGGSLGSSYFQCRNFLSVVSSLQWGVVEQEHFVRCGKADFETEQLRFFFTIAECMAHALPNVVLLSSVLQYLPQPNKVLDNLIAERIQYVVIDRTPFSDASVDRITIQHVPPSIYPASYPCRIFSRQSFLDRLQGHYDVITQFDSNDGRASVKGLEFAFGGMILRKT